MKAVIRIHLKPHVSDPESDTICRTMHAFGLEEVQSVRMSKVIEVELRGRGLMSTRQKMETLCEEWLSKADIETYELEWVTGKLSPPKKKASLPSSEEKQKGPDPSAKKKKDKKKKKKKKKKAKALPKE